ncbi:MAG: inositol-phosphate phosphatase [uncultured bacterium]|nr:MAG: inositol-phosphate phosphatase [uncultured bacterium]
MQQSVFLKTAFDAIKASDEIIMSYYHGDIQVETKADMSPVTMADKEAEAAIKDIISRAFPDHGFIGEEFGTTEGEHEYRWVIDPIDGTKNFIRHIPLFGTQLALVKGTDIILGVSSMPAMGELLYAERGKGAFLNGKKIHVSDVSSLSDSMICFGGISHFEKIGKMVSLTKLLVSTSRQRGIGDCYMYHLLATGRTDSVVESSINFWDIAAAVCIVEEAGGKISDLNGASVHSETKTFLATNSFLYDDVLQFFSSSSL